MGKVRLEAGSWARARVEARARARAAARARARVEARARARARVRVRVSVVGAARDRLSSHLGGGARRQHGHVGLAWPRGGCQHQLQVVRRGRHVHEGLRLVQQRCSSTRASLLDRIGWRASQLVKHVVRRSRRWLSTSRCAVATCCHLRASRSRRGTAVILAARYRAARARLAAAEELRLERCSGHRRRLSCLLLLVSGRRGVHLHPRGLLRCRGRLSGSWLGVLTTPSEPTRRAN